MLDQYLQTIESKLITYAIENKSTLTKSKKNKDIGIQKIIKKEKTVKKSVKKKPKQSSSKLKK